MKNNVIYTLQIQVEQDGIKYICEETDITSKILSKKDKEALEVLSTGYCNTVKTVFETAIARAFTK